MANSRLGSGNFKFPIGKTLKITENLILPLRELLEPLTPEKDIKESLINVSKLASVGDLVTYTLVRHKILPDICIVDFKTLRDDIEVSMKKEISIVGEQDICVENPAGTITTVLWTAIENAYSAKKSTRIEVKGEEDLASLACLSIAPIGTAVIYGVPNMGIEVVHTNKKTRDFANIILSKMAVV